MIKCNRNVEGEVCLLDISCLFGRIVSITQFNKGKASQLFLRASRGETLLVMKNNSPVAVVISPEEYEILRKIPRLCSKTSVNGNDISSGELADLLDKLKSFDENGEKNV